MPLGARRLGGGNTFNSISLEGKKHLDCWRKIELVLLNRDMKGIERQNCKSNE